MTLSNQNKFVLYAKDEEEVFDLNQSCFVKNPHDMNVLQLMKAVETLREELYQKELSLQAIMKEKFKYHGMLKKGTILKHNDSGLEVKVIRRDMDGEFGDFQRVDNRKTIFSGYLPQHSWTVIKECL